LPLIINQLEGYDWVVGKYYGQKKSIFNLCLTCYRSKDKPPGEWDDIAKFLFDGPLFQESLKHYSREELIGTSRKPFLLEQILTTTEGLQFLQRSKVRANQMNKGNHYVLTLFVSLFLIDRKFSDQWHLIKRMKKDATCFTCAVGQRTFLR